ncbi:MAG TPA: fibronectin type III domain-containing protein [Solirubrobacterales bacterium]
MRRHAKAATAGSTQNRAPKAGPLKPILAAALLASALLIILASSAQAAAPTLSATWSESIVFTEATLRAEVNPEGKATSYRFEYGTSAAYGQQTPLISIGSGSAAVKVSRFLEGLQPGATYHYRVLATNADGTSEGPDRTFTTYVSATPRADCPNQAFRYGPGAALPDCRGYEMVSPIEKNGDIAALETELGRGQFMQSSLSGDKITYSSYRSFGDALSGPYVSQYIASRGAGGWSTHALSAPQGTTIFDPIFSGQEQVPFYEAFSPDLSSGWLFDFNKAPLTADALPGYANLYRRDTATDSYEALTNEGPFAPLPPKTLGYSEASFTLAFEGASDDLGQQIFRVAAALTPNAAATHENQVYDLSNGQLHLVSVLPNGEPYSGNSSAGGVGGTDIRRSGNLDHAISNDGSRVFWGDGKDGYGDGPTYVRENPAAEQSALNGSGECIEPAKACTRLIGNGQLWSASADGSRALFSGSSSDLIASAAPLWIVDVDSGAETHIAGEVAGIFGWAEDLSYVYFASKENLASGATAGTYNLYAWHEGAIAFIGTLSELDRKQYRWDELGPEEFRQARVTPNGRHLAFMSSASLTGYDNIDATSGEADFEVFVYDAGAARLHCASCDPAGARPAGGRLAQRPFRVHHADGKGNWAAAWIPAPEWNTDELHPLSADGGRLFFNSFDALVPHDTNGKQDVYQWEAPGSGDCSEASPQFSQRNGGCVSLISSGESSELSELIDASADGSNVFFETISSLAPQDPGLVDIYDARINGGFPYVAPSEPCVGDTCQDVPPAPNDQTPASASFHGQGNPSTRKAKKHIRCRARKHAAKSKRTAKRAKHTKSKRCRGAKRGAAR